MDKHVLAFDIGTTSIKCGLVSLNNFKPIKIVKKENDIIFNKEGWAEQEPEKLWLDVLDLSRRIKEESKIVANALIFDAHMAGIVPVDNGGYPLRNMIIWLDERASGLPRDLFSGFIKIQGYSVPKLLKFLRITGGAPSKTGKDFLSKIVWIKENERNIFQKTYKFLDVKGFLINRCTGKFVTSQDEASLTWLADTRKAKAVWSDSILKSYKLAKEKFPEIKQSVDIVGETKGEIAKEIGNVPVFIGAGDLTAAAIGSGAVKEKEPHIYIGTSDWIAYHTSKRKVDIVHYIGCILSAIPNKYLFVAEQEVASGALEWAMKMLGMEKNYKEVEEIVKNTASTNIIFLPWLYGERAPVDNPLIRGGLINVSLDTNKGEILKAIMEGVSFNIKWIFPYVAKDAKEINIVGGAALFDSWCQIISDCLEIKIKRVEYPELTGIRGLSMIASVGMGIYKNFEEASSKIVIEREFLPRKENSEKMKKKFKEFIKLYKKLKDTCKNLNS